MPTAIDYRQQITEELSRVPEEKLADLAKIVHVFTEDSPQVRLGRACQQAKDHELVPLDSVWDSLDD